jgi:hypothetical protein
VGLSSPPHDGGLDDSSLKIGFGFPFSRHKITILNCFLRGRPELFTPTSGAAMMICDHRTVLALVGRSQKTAKYAAHHWRGVLVCQNQINLLLISSANRPNERA